MLWLICASSAVMTAVTPSPDPTKPVYAPGDLIAGKYALEEQLGEGGMGAVFKARNVAIDMPVAIKVIRADLDRQLLTGRLLQEARAAAKVSHPAIVRVFDVGQTVLGDPFIVMELLHGESLAEALERDRRIAAMRAVQLLLPIVDGLSAAHAKGLVHRDVKPDNIFIALDEEGQLQPKLVDFGIVKQVQQVGSSQLTQLGSVLGSPEYMSPEQARGLDHVDARSDVWSLSVVLYESISGVVPFESENYNALMRLIVEHSPPTLRELLAGDDALSAIVMRGLAKDPAARWQSMTELGKALAAWLLDQGINADACGVSLQARWLLRSSDPSALNRGSRGSIPDGWPEPPSGVRAVETWRERLHRATPPGSTGLANAPTIHAVKQAGTPAPSGSGGVKLQKRGPALAGLCLGAAVLIGGLLWLLTRESAGPATTAGTGKQATSAPSPEPPRAAPSPASPSPASTAPEELAAEPAAVQPPTSPSPKSAKPSARSAAPRSAANHQRGAPPSSRASEGSDLLAPY